MRHRATEYTAQMVVDKLRETIKSYREDGPGDDVLTAAVNEIVKAHAALHALLNNPWLHLGDLVYVVREREGEGWEGPAVRAWSDAVVAAEEIMKGRAT